MKKVYFFIPSMKRAGGTEGVAARLSNLWQDRFQIKIINREKTSKSFFSLHSNVKMNSLDIDNPVGILEKIYFVFSCIVKLRKKLKSDQPDYLLCFCTFQACIAFFASWRLRIKIIAFEHQNYFMYKDYVVGIRKINFLFRRIIYPYLDFIVVLTDRDKCIYNQFCKKVVSIPNILPELKKNIVINYSNKNVIAVGRVCKLKGFDFLVTAWKELHTQYPNWKLFVVGEFEQDEYFLDLEKYLEKHNLLECVIFTGRKTIDEVMDFYSQASIFVLSSRSEAFPLVLQEAMSIGLATISFDCFTGPRELIENEENGILVEPENTKALALALSKLINNEEYRKKLGINALNGIKLKYSKDKIDSLWQKIFNE